MGQCGEEDFQGHRHGKHRENAQRERDIRGHRDTPAAGKLPAVVEGRIHESRDEHATHRGDHRQGRFPGAGQFAGQQFALDLQTDDEKEDAHQAVGDPVADGFAQVERSDREGEFRV